MSFLLTSAFEDSFEYEGNTIHLDLSFDNILRVFELFSDEMFTAFEKIDIALEMLIQEHEVFKDANIQQKNELVLFVFREFLDIDLGKENDSAEPRIVDFNQDAGIIYASFLHAYNIDLFEQHGKLHWRKFIQLFQHLDDKSKIKEIMGIRKMPMPQPQRGNEEYRKQIAEMKRIYALKQPIKEEKTQENINKVFDSLAQTFKK